MLCEHCNTKPASVHYTQVVNNQRTELHLCDECAKNEGYMPNHDQFININMGELFSNMLEKGQTTSKQVVPMLRCNTCATTFEQFAKRGKLGCSDCYTAFEPNIAPILRKIHGHTAHVGKVPNGADEKIKAKRNLEQLTTRLQQAIAEERFEEAAVLRDKIKKLSNQ